MTYSSDLLLINVMIWIIMFCMVKPYDIIIKPQIGNIQTKTFYTFFSLLFVYCIFAFAEHDTYHYWTEFASNSHLNKNHYEPIYQYIYNLTNHEYFLWRSVVWGIACIALIILANLLKEQNYSLLLGIVLFLPTSFFVATRGSSGHALALLSFILIIGGKPYYKRHILLGLIGIVISIFFHKSNFLYILFLILSGILPIRFNKKFIIISWIAFPFFTEIIGRVLFSYISGKFGISFGEEMNIQKSALHYASSEMTPTQMNFNGFIGRFISLFPLLLCTLYLTNRIVFKKIQIGRPYMYLYKLTYITIYIGFLFFFQTTSIWIYQRILFMSLFSTPFIFAKVISMERAYSPWILWIVIFQILSVAFTFCYRYMIWSHLNSNLNFL